MLFILALIFCPPLAIAWALFYVALIVLQPLFIYLSVRS